jgi:hypothetical protein
LNIPKTERNNPRIGSFSLSAIESAIEHDLAFQSLRSDGFKHHIGRHSALVKLDME